jgi:hypothetical protein
MAEKTNRKWSPAERFIAISAVINNVSLESVNEIMTTSGFDPIEDLSFFKKYADKIVDGEAKLDETSLHPKNLW